MGCDWDDALHCCWRCGKKTDTQRCHIIQAAEPFNGPDVPSNYVLLCERCHHEAPCVNDARYMWQWIKDTHRNFTAGKPSIHWYWTQNKDLIDAITEAKTTRDKRNQEIKILVSDNAAMRGIVERVGSHPGAGVLATNFRFALRKFLEHVQQT